MPVSLEDLSPDSIDAQTFDFETIGHPGMDPVLQPDSLDLDSLAESPESDFMSAVNEFVIEENLTSPNPISDPTSPDMMVESLYSSVINAIDSKRIQDTTTLERENARVAALRLCADRYRAAAEESQSGLRSVRDDLHHFRGLVAREQRDFGFVLKTVTVEVRDVVSRLQLCHEEELRESHRAELDEQRREHERQLLTLTEELEANRGIVRDVQRAMLELEGRMERKEKEIAQLEGERERASEELRASHQQSLQELRRELSERAEEIKAALASRDELAGQLTSLQQDAERAKEEARQETRAAEQERLRELEEALGQQHGASLESERQQQRDALERLAQEHQEALKSQQELHGQQLEEREGRLRELEARVQELADARCKLEVEMALKEAEMEDARLQQEEARARREEELQARVEAQAEELREQAQSLEQKLRERSEEHEVGLAELRALLRREKDHCISELVERHEEELGALRQAADDARREADERLRALRLELGERSETERADAEEREQRLLAQLGDLQAENALLAEQCEHGKQREVEERDEAVRAALADALRNFELQKEEVEKRLLEKIQVLENQLQEKQTSDRLVKLCPRQTML